MSPSRLANSTATTIAAIAASERRDGARHHARAAPARDALVRADGLARRPGTALERAELTARCASRHSTASASRVPRYSAPSSRSRRSHSRAATPSARWMRRPSRSSSIQSRSRGHSRSSASCASSTRARADGQQAAIGQQRDDARDVLVARRSRARRARPGGARRAPPSPVADEPHAARRARRPAGRVVELREGVLGEPRDGAVHAAGLLVGAVAQAAAVAALPQLEQRGRQQRQAARLALDVGDERVDELGLDAQPRALGRALDRAPQLVAAHRADEHVVGGEQRRQLGIGGAAAVVVGAQRDHDDVAPARIAGGLRRARR